MDAIEHWKHIIRQANSAFAHDHYALAADLYQQATRLLAQSWPQYEARLARRCINCLTLKPEVNLYADRYRAVAGFQPS